MLHQRRPQPTSRLHTHKQPCQRRDEVPPLSPRQAERHTISHLSRAHGLRHTPEPQGPQRRQRCAPPHPRAAARGVTLVGRPQDSARDKPRRHPRLHTRRRHRHHEWYRRVRRETLIQPHKQEQRIPVRLRQVNNRAQRPPVGDIAEQDNRVEPQGEAARGSRGEADTRQQRLLREQPRAARRRDIRLRRQRRHDKPVARLARLHLQHRATEVSPAPHLDNRPRHHHPRERQPHTEPHLRHPRL